MIAELHSHDDQIKIIEDIRNNLPKTKKLFYKDHYLKEFDAEIIWKNSLKKYTEIILDKTSFYPEGGGQPGDKGFFEFEDKKIKVVNTLKEGDAILHLIDGDLSIGDKVRANIDWNYRYSLMKHHTGTHVVNAALRKKLGEHIWQAGSQIYYNEARFDFAHYKKISENDIESIEKIANDLVLKGREVEKRVIDRNKAEKIFGFRLYQGGVPPGNSIRVINIPDVDVEACGGTHLNNIDEIEQIRILKSERIQDGVNRITFAAGKMVEVFELQESKQFKNILKLISPKYSIKNNDNIGNQLNKASKIFSVPVDKLESTIKKFMTESEDDKIIVKDLEEACHKIFNKWKKNNKLKKRKSAEKDVYKNISHEIKRVGNIEIILIPKMPKTYNELIIAGQTTIDHDNKIILIGSERGVICACSENLTNIKNIDCSKIIKESGKILGGGGGGSKTLAQSGGPKKQKIDEAFKITLNIIMKMLN
jgi:alanyl-tRNA synthetase